VPRTGYIYILQNPSLGGDLLKVGKTTRDPRMRAKELSGTSLPDSFVVVYFKEVLDCDKAERAVHRLLEPYRHSPNREFFKLPLMEAEKAVDAAASGLSLIEDVLLPSRSLLEVRWATFFESLGLEYTFVRPQFAAESAACIPSFWLEGQNCWLVVAPGRLDGETRDRLFQYAGQRSQLVFTFGDCRPLELVNGDVVGSGQYFTPSGSWDGCMEFGLCPSCGTIQIGHFGSHDVTFEDDGFSTFKDCEGHAGSFTDSPHLKKAYATAEGISV
jgi:hypothetical protein